MNFYIAPIVEGKTEQKGAIRELFGRIWYTLLGRTESLIVLESVRGSRDVLGKPSRDADLERKIQEAHIGVRDRLVYDPDALWSIFLILDADEDCPKKLGPALLASAQKKCPHLSPFTCVLAVREFENWLVAGAAGFRGRTDLDLPDPLQLPTDPEASAGASWLVKQRQKVNRSKTYKKTVDAVPFIKAMDLVEAHRTSRSFRKLCRELEKLIPPAAPPDPNPPVQTAE